MNKAIKALGMTGTILLGAGLIIKLTDLPDQIIVLAVAFILLMLGFFPLYFFRNIRSSMGAGLKILDTFGFLITIGALLMLITGALDRVFPFKLITILLLAALAGYICHKILKVANDMSSHVFFAVITGLSALLSYLNAPVRMQVPDILYHPQIQSPAYREGMGSAIFLDEAHNNFHTLGGLYSAFGKILRKDGYKVESFKEPFSEESLQKVDILVISNALSKKNIENWTNPVHSAFMKEEIAALKRWVDNGGSLFLIADHMPFPGAARDLAKTFNFNFVNGFAMDTLGLDDIFIRKDSTLNDNIITQGRNTEENIDTVMSFTGQAFMLPDDATPVLIFRRGYMQWEPDTAWEFNNTLPYPIEGFCQGAYKKTGSGRVVIFGEAMMFTSQLGAGLSWIKLGISNPEAVDNQQLLLNIIHWLDNLLD
jgi:hypothetical protein